MMVVGGGEFRLRLGGAWPWGRRGCRSRGFGFHLRRATFRLWSIDFGRWGVFVVGSYGAQPWGWRGCRNGGSGCFASAVKRRGHLRRVASRSCGVDLCRLGVLVVHPCGARLWSRRGCRSGGSGFPPFALALRGFGVGHGCLGNLTVDPGGGAALGPVWIELYFFLF